MSSAERHKSSPASLKRTSSGRVVKQNTKYGTIQGKVFQHVINKLVGGPGSDEECYGDEEDYYDDEEESAGPPDLAPEDINNCLICWSECTAAEAAAESFNQLNRYVYNSAQSESDLVVGALTMELKTDAKFELICQECATLIRVLEERETQVNALRQELLARFNASRQHRQADPLADAAPAHEQHQQEVRPTLEKDEQPGHEKDDQSAKTTAQTEHLSEADYEFLEQEQALQSLLMYGEGGMYGVPGLGARSHFSEMSAPPPPPSVEANDPTPLELALSRQEDTVEAYLNRKVEWITQTPGANESPTGLVKAIVQASAEAVDQRSHEEQDAFPCCSCARVFNSAEALMRHEYFRHGVGELCGAGRREMSLDVDAKKQEGKAKTGTLKVRTGLVKGGTMPKETHEDGCDDGNYAGECIRGRNRTSDDVNMTILDVSSSGDTSALDSSNLPSHSQVGIKRKPGRPKKNTARSGECPYCSTFIKTDLQGHVNRFHTMIRPHECPSCHEKLPSQHALSLHKRIAHGSGYPCDYCDAAFVRRKQLAVHQWRKHNIGGVQCRVCGKKFARSDTLDGHMRCHERPLQCSLCPARYPYKRELRNHEYLKHGLHGEIPRDSEYMPGEMYRCEKCGRCFGSWAGRDRHQCDTSSALSDLYVCQLCGDWSTRFEGDMVKHMRNLHKIEAETILIADADEDDVEDDALGEAVQAGDSLETSNATKVFIEGELVRRK